MVTPRDILIYARGEVAKGWIQKSFENENGVCALGGVSRAYSHFYRLHHARFITPGNQGPLHPIVDSALRALKAQTPTMLSYWNDEEGRTQEEVLELFDRAIATLPGKSKEIDVPEPQQVPEPDRVIHVDPIQTPAPVPDPEPVEEPEPAPVKEPEKVPA